MYLKGVLAFGTLKTRLISTISGFFVSEAPVDTELIPLLPYHLLREKTKLTERKPPQTCGFTFVQYGEGRVYLTASGVKSGNQSKVL